MEINEPRERPSSKHSFDVHVYKHGEACLAWFLVWFWSFAEEAAFANVSLVLINYVHHSFRSPFKSRERTNFAPISI